MKSVFISIICILFLLNGESVVRVNKTDSTFADHDVSRISNITFGNLFTDSLVYELKVNKTDGSTDVFDIRNIKEILLTPSDSTGIDISEELLNKLSISLLSNYPNPFNPETNINFHLGNSGMTKVEIFNNTGQKVTTLFQGHLNAGKHTLKWNAGNYNTVSGIYFVRVSDDEQAISNKMILVK